MNCLSIPIVNDWLSGRLDKEWNMAADIDVVETNKVKTNKLLFSFYRCDYFDIETAIDILGLETLPVEIPINNNQVFIRDLTNYIVTTNLKPNIGKK